MSWWKCPNDPPCGHAGLLHDVEDYEDPLPTCCVEGCRCGHDPEKRKRLLDELTCEALDAGTYDEPAPEVR